MLGCWGVRVQVFVFLPGGKRAGGGGGGGGAGGAQGGLGPRERTSELGH